MARPIPQSVMTETMQAFLRDPESDYEGAWLDPVTIEHVRFERAEQLANTSYKLSDGAAGRIWVDAVNSKGAFKVPMGSKVVIGGESFIVDKCMTYKCGSRVHHWELDVR